MNKFEIINKYAGVDLELPQRATARSAGYDFAAVEDIIIPAGEVKLIPTGIKCQLDGDCYLELAIRSSMPLKRQLMLANGEGIVDADYYNNPANEGHIMFQILNFGERDAVIKKGEKIGQGIIKQFLLAEGDIATGERTGGFGSTSNE